MIAAWALLAAAALGHACLTVTSINRLHGLGLPEHTTDRLTYTLAAAMALLAAACAWAMSSPQWASWPRPVQVYAGACVLIALGVLPADILWRRLRRPPEGVTIRSEAAAIAPERAPAEFIGRGRHAWMLRLPGNQALGLRRTEACVEVPGLPPVCDGLSLVHVTDLHLARAYDRRYFEAVVAEAARWPADLVVYTGDLADDLAALDWVATLLAPLRGRLGQFAILGNHDWERDPERARRALQEAGFADLDGRWERLDLDGAALALGGTSAPWGPALDPADVPEADLRILLSHTPDLIDRAAEMGADLMLCGHNHGGQVRLPVVGPVLMPSRYGRRFDRGAFRRGPTLVYVSQGIGGKHPIRYNCPPEITRLVLRPAPVRPEPAGSHCEGRDVHRVAAE